jgi:hypothetical protein
MLEETHIYYTYVLINPLKPSKESYIGGISLYDNEPFYFGISKREERLNEHLACYDTDKNGHKKNTIKKIQRNGSDPIFIKILENVDEQIAKNKEIEMIAYYGRFDKKLGPLTNMTDGGDGFSGFIRTEEHKRKISEALKGCKGRKKNQDEKDKISFTCKKFYQTEEGKEIKKNQSENSRGNGNYNFGKKLSEESIEKRTKTRHENGNYKQSESAKEKCRQVSNDYWNSPEGQKRKTKLKNKIPLNKGKKLYNNGILQKCFKEGKQPEGWTKGSIKNP